MKSGMDENAQQMREEITNKMDTNTNKMEANTNGIKEEMKDEMEKMRGEMRQMGQCLQAGIMATPRAATNELKGRAPAGENRVIRETCTGETRREVTELTETREIEKRLHGMDGVKKDEHTHTQR